MTNYASGHHAEQVAADYLKTHGYEILELNWRTRYCEIDIIAKRKKTMHFFEVKYRKTGDQGSGLEYITSKKLKQMQFAAELWVTEHGWNGEYVLSAIEVSGEDYAVTHVVENITL